MQALLSVLAFFRSSKPAKLTEQEKSALRNEAVRRERNWNYFACRFYDGSVKHAGSEYRQQQMLQVRDLPWNVRP